MTGSWILNDTFIYRKGVFTNTLYATNIFSTYYKYVDNGYIIIYCKSTTLRMAMKI